MSIRWFEQETLDRVVADHIQKVNVVLDIYPALQPQMFFRPALHICCEPHPQHVRILQDHFGGTSRFVILQASALETLKVMPDGSVDSVFLINSIEHLQKDEGRRLLRHCERVARRQIVVFSPLEFVPQEEYETGDDEDGRGLHGGSEHRARRSEWTPEDFDGSWEILAAGAYYSAEAKGEEPLDDPPLGAFWAIKNIRRIINLPVKLAVLAQDLPPSPSVNGVYLYRMFKDLNPDDYCLLSEKDYEPYSHLQYSLLKGTLNATPRLPARYYHLPSGSSSGPRGQPEGSPPPREGPPATRLEGGLESPLARSVRARMPKWLKPQLARDLINGWRASRRLVNRLVKEVLGCLRRAREVARVVRGEECGAILAFTGDPFDLPAGYLASRLARVPFYAYILDDYLHQWDPTPYRHFARLVGPTVLKGAAGIIVLNEFLRDEYQQRYRVDPTVIHNPIEVAETEEDADAPPWPANEGEIRIVYTGTVYHANYDAFRNLIAAISQLSRPEVKLHLYTAQTHEELKRENISGPGVVYHEHVASSEVFEVQQKADILFLALAFDSSIPDVIRTSLPNKTVEYLASGRPILVHAPADSFASWYFREHECGVVVDRSDSAMLAQAIERIIEGTNLRRKIGERARVRVESDFSLAAAQAEFVKLLQSGAKE